MYHASLLVFILSYAEWKWVKCFCQPHLFCMCKLFYKSDSDSFLTEHCINRATTWLAVCPISAFIQCRLRRKHLILSTLGSFFMESFHCHLFFFLGLLVRLWSDKQKTCTSTTTSRGTSNLSTRALRFSRLRKMWRMTTYLTSEITAGKRDRQVSTNRSTLFIRFFSSSPNLSQVSFFPSLLSHPETDLLYAAKVYRDDRMRKKAEQMTMDNCRELDRLNKLFRGG